MPCLSSCFQVQADSLPRICLACRSDVSGEEASEGGNDIVDFFRIITKLGWTIVVRQAHIYGDQPCVAEHLANQLCHLVSEVFGQP